MAWPNIYEAISNWKKKGIVFVFSCKEWWSKDLYEYRKQTDDCFDGASAGLSPTMFFPDNIKKQEQE